MKSLRSCGKSSGVLVALAVFVGGGTMLASWLTERVDQHLREALLNQARLAAAAVNVDRIKALRERATDLECSDYRRLKEQLASVSVASQLARYIYLLGRGADGTIRCLADGEPPVSAICLAPSQVHEEAPARSRRVFEDHEAAVEGPVSDRWGSRVSAFAPLIDPASGRAVAVLGMDVDARDWKWMVASQVAWQMGLVLASLILPVATFAVLYGLNAGIRSQHRAVRENREYLEATLRSIGDGVIACDREGKVKSLNRAAEALTGWTTAEAAGRPLEEVFQIIHAQTGETVENPVARALAEGVNVELANHTVLIARDGTRRHIADSCAPIRDAAEAVTGAVLVFRDVTEEYRRREELRESHARYQRVVANVSDVIWSCEIDPRGQLVGSFISPVADRLLDLPPGTIGNDLDLVFRYVHPEDRPRVQQQLATAYQWVGKKHPGTEYRLVTAHGETKWVRTYGEICLLPNGNISLFGTTTDITERRRMEEALRESATRLEQLAEQSRTIAWEVDAEGLYTYVSPVVEKVLGYRPEELVGKMYFYDLHPEEGREAFKTAAFKVFDEKEYFANFENAVVAKDGRVMWVSTNGMPLLNADGTLRGYRGSDTDITERKRAEQALRESEARFLDVLYASEDAILLIDDNTFVDCNEATARMLGYATREEFLQTHPSELSPPRQPDGRDSFEKAEEMMRLAFERGFHRFEWIHRRANGEDFPVEVSLTPISYRGKSMLHCVWRDITAVQQAQARLLDSEQKHRLLFEHALAGTAVHEIIWDAQGKPLDFIILDANPAFEKHTGWRIADVLGRRITELLPGIEKTSLIEIFGKVVQTGESVNFEQFVETMQRHYEINAYKIGENRFATVFADVTERKRTLAELEEQKRTLQTILDGIPDVIALQGVDHTILAYNKAGYELLGLPPEQVHGRKCYELLGRGTPCEDCATTQALATKQVVSRERYVKERRRWIRATSIPIFDSAGRITMLVEQLQDITEQKRVQEELKNTIAALETANRNLEELNRIAESATRAKSEFLANMSHEIRTPMTAILGFAELLLGEPGLEQAPPERREAILTIQRNGNYLLELINDILDLSKIEAGKLDIERIACSPTQILGDVVSLMRVRANAKNLALRLQYVGGIPETIHSDPVRLRQILINLISNAIKFTEVGEVRVVARLVRRLGKPALFQIDVIDTGIGLTEEQVSRLFKPFSQADSSTTRKFGGTGLGLTISKRLAEMLGGDIILSSAPGKGSTFSVTVEAGDLEGVRLLEWPSEAAVSVKTAAPDKTPPAPRLDGRILLAEDGPDNQRLIAFVLRKAGARVTVAENGQIAHDEALAARDRGEPYDLILMDMQMPVMDGYTATTKLREAGYTGPIVALTAHAMEGDELKCRAAGCDGYLTKPIDRPKFLQAIAQILQSAKVPVA